MKNYKILNEEEIKKYSVEKLKAFSDISNLSCTEIGDGNLNNIFRVVDNKTNKSLIIKQAPPYARTSVEMELNAQRCKIEAMSLMEQRKYAKAMVPEVYSYDEELCAMAMEDMTGHSILRTAMMEQVKFPKMAKHAATFFANTLLRTSDVVLGNKLKKDEVARFQNNDLCELTENLVLTQPTFASTRNRIDEYLLPFVKENVYGNSELELAFAQLKYKFMTEAQALLHGDAHSGSMFVTQEDTKFFDTEFAFYGPMGFDIGMFTGNLIMNACYQSANEFNEYREYVINTIMEFVDTFKQEFILVWDEFATEHFAKESESFKEWYLEEVLKDAAGYCGCEMIRRTIGSSHVKEMDEYEDEAIKKEAQINNITMAIELVLNPEGYVSGNQYKELLIRHL